MAYPEKTETFVEEMVISQCVRGILNSLAEVPLNIEDLCLSAAHEALLCVKDGNVTDIRMIATIIHAACEGVFNTRRLWADNAPLALARQVRYQLGFLSRRKRRERKMLSAEEAAYVNNLIIRSLDHTPETLAMVEDVHRFHTISTEAFDLLQRESLRNAAAEFGKGGFLEALTPTAEEHRLHQEKTRETGGREYESPAEFYRKLILERSPARGDVIIHATPDGRNVCIVRLHPKDPVEHQMFAEANRHFFDGTYWLPRNRRESLEPIYGELMEISMIACRDRGVADHLIMSALTYANEHEYDVAGIFLEHFGCLRRVSPSMDTRVAPQIENLRSRSYFERLAAGLCAEWGTGKDFVFRTVSPDVTIGAEVTWDVRFAERSQFEHNLRGELWALELYKTGSGVPPSSSSHPTDFDPDIP